MFNFKYIVIGTLFQFGNIMQNLIINLFMHVLQYDQYHIIFKQCTLQGTSSSILKTHLF